ncbi:MAG TPA: hypothetical protein VKB96_14000 [Gammaproteobacteria bacterium]|nr:hypothetical protein [Gammaproteobacteria bacterium]
MATAYRQGAYEALIIIRVALIPVHSLRLIRAAGLLSPYRGRLVVAMRPTGPYPVLILQGEQGTAKSTAAKVLRLLIDPSAAPLRTAPRDERDLMIAARNGWIIALDNLSGLSSWLSDALCRIATGGGVSTRELYSDTDEVLIDVQRPIILNGIDDIATRQDLIDRSIIINLEPIPENKRKPEAEFWQ